MDLKNKIFDLIENQDGLAESHTRMIFNGNSLPFRATYSGPNVSSGQVLVSTNANNDLNMVYHALASHGSLVAGKADISFTTIDNTLTMKLNWQWLTGDLSSGVSMWKEHIA